MDFSQNKRCLRYIRAQRSELFSVFARRLAYEMVNTSSIGFSTGIGYLKQIHIV